MGTTLLFLYSRSLRTISSELICQSIRALEPTETWVSIHRAGESDDSWDAYLAEYASPPQEGWRVYTADKFRIPRCPIDEVSRHYIDDDLTLTTDLAGSNCRLFNDLHEQAKALTPDVRKTCEFAHCALRLGYHDIFFPAFARKEPAFIARPLISLLLEGYDVPNLEAFLTAVQQLPAMVAIKGALEQIWGDLDIALIPY